MSDLLHTLPDAAERPSLPSTSCLPITPLIPNCHNHHHHLPAPLMVPATSPKILKIVIIIITGSINYLTSSLIQNFHNRHSRIYQLPHFFSQVKAHIREKSNKCTSLPDTRYLTSISYVPFQYDMLAMLATYWPIMSIWCLIISQEVLGFDPYVPKSLLGEADLVR